MPWEIWADTSGVLSRLGLLVAKVIGESGVCGCGTPGVRSVPEGNDSEGTLSNVTSKRSQGLIPLPGIYTSVDPL